MIKNIIALIIAACVALYIEPACAQTNAPTPSDPALDNLMKQVGIKLEAGKNTEADLQPELKQFDSLIAAHQKDNSPDEVAMIIFLKAKIYLEVLGDLPAGADLVKQIKTDYPNTTPGKAADDILAQVNEALAEQKLPDNLASGLPFPDFSEKDLSGKPISVAGSKGKVVMIDFWATWCPPCRRELPHVIALYQKYHDNGFDIIGVSLDDQRGKLDDFLKEQTEMTWPQYYDGKGWQNELVLKYQVKSVPCTILIGKDGKIIGTYLSGGKLDAAVSDALAK